MDIHLNIHLALGLLKCIGKYATTGYYGSHVWAKLSCQILSKRVRNGRNNTKLSKLIKKNSMKKWDKKMKKCDKNLKKILKYNVKQKTKWEIQ